MIGQLPQVERLDAGDAPATWRETLARVAAGEARVLLERDGRRLAALISVADFRRFIEWEARHRESVAALTQLQQAYAEAFAGVPQEEIEAEIAKAIKEVRAEQATADHRAASS